MVWETKIEKDTAQVFYALELCEQLDIGHKTVGAAITFGDPAMIEELARRLLTVQPKGPGRALIDYLCSAMVCRCAEAHMPPPPDLASLVSRQLSADTFAARDHKKPLAFGRAVQYFTAHPEASVREIARYAGINHNTVSKWKTDGALEKMAERYEKLIPGNTDAMKAYFKTVPELSGKKGLP
jgi:hypothetical protein